MTAPQPDFELRFAETDDDLYAAQRLRYQVFVEEMGGDGEMVDHEARLERDALDPYYRHLILFDRSRPEDDQAIGVYRLLPGDGAEIDFYTAAEYDLAPILASGRKLLELGRSCLHRDYRGGAAMYHIWQGLAGYVQENGIEILFGTASFHGTDIDALAAPLSLLHHRHLAPEDLRVTARPEHFQSMDLIPADQLDRAAAVRQIPALIKAYLRLGGVVGEGAYVDTAFNTTDVCLIVDTTRLNARQKSIYASERAT